MNGTLIRYISRVCIGGGKRWIPELNRCLGRLDRFHDKPNACTAKPSFGNPIYPLTGSKRITLDLDPSLGGLMQLSYDTRRKVVANKPTSLFLVAAPPSFGELWETSVHKRLILQTSNGKAIQAARGLGAWVSFLSEPSGNYVPDADIKDRLVAVPGGWRYFDAASRAVESYDNTGTLVSIATAGGANWTFNYSDANTLPSLAPAAGLLIKVQDHLGRNLQFNYEQPSDAGLKPRIAVILNSANQKLIFGYESAGNLRQITWPDSSRRQFLYEAAAAPFALTGVLDENLRRTATYGYDTSGRVISTESAGGVNRYTVAWSTGPSWQITDTYDSAAGVFWRDHNWVAPQGTVVTLPNGQATQLSVSTVLGASHLNQQSQPAGSGCGASTSAQTYDANGNIATRDDFNGNRICYAHDLTRNLETTRVEGLAGGTACTATASGAALPAGARKTSTQWHPDWSLRTRQAEPGRFTTYVYNGQPDHYAAGALASCAPASAVLPDGKPIVVLCRQVEQATNDTDGSQGFAAALQANVPAREQKWTYNAFGQVLTHDGPRTDVADITVNEYYADTSFTGTDPNAVGHTLGDLKQTTTPAGHVTRYTLYSKLGQVLQMQDPNGVVTAYTFDARQRLTSTSTAGQTTLYDYWPTGLPKRTSQADQSWVQQDYDDAHRLVRVSDNLGNSISYTLDNLGNRTAEEVRDPSNSLRRVLSRSIDALGRVQQVTGRE